MKPKTLDGGSKGKKEERTACLKPFVPTKTSEEKKREKNQDSELINIITMLCYQWIAEMAINVSYFLTLRSRAFFVL